MNKNKFVVVTFCLVLLFAIGAPTAVFADEWDHATQLTFSGPVEVPGRVLSAGTYWFKLANTDSDRDIVQIWNADRRQLMTTVMAIPDYRLKPTGKTVVNFEEGPSDAPEAIHAWFYPGSSFGEEFVYPKTRAVKLAQQTSQPVLAVREEQPPKPIQQAPVIAVNPSGEEIEVAEVVESQPAAPQLAQSSLPQTASPLPLLAFLSALLLAGAVVLRVTRQMV